MRIILQRNERIAAAYLSFSKKLHKTTVNIGLRNEYTDARGYTVKQDLNNRWLYNRLFPTLIIEQTFDKKNKLSVSVSRRITRPVYTTLNPVRWYVDQYFYYSGNPELVPEMAWVFSTAYTLNNKYVLTASYSHRNNYLTRRLVVDETGTIKSQSANFRYMQRVDLLLSAPFQAASFWDVQFTGGVNYTSYPVYQMNGSLAVKQWAGYLQVQQQIKLPLKLQLELATFYYSPELFGVYITDDRFYCDAGIKRTLLKGKFTVQGTFSDFLRTNRYKGFSQTDLIDYHYFDRPDTHRFGLSVRYQIGGKLINKKGARIEEQDRL